MCQPVGGQPPGVTRENRPPHLALCQVQLQADRRCPVADKLEWLVQLQWGTQDVGIIEVPGLPGDECTEILGEVLYGPGEGGGTARVTLLDSTLTTEHRLPAIKRRRAGIAGFHSGHRFRTVLPGGG